MLGRFISCGGILAAGFCCSVPQFSSPLTLLSIAASSFTLRPAASSFVSASITGLESLTSFASATPCFTGSPCVTHPSRLSAATAPRFLFAASRSRTHIFSFKPIFIPVVCGPCLDFIPTFSQDPLFIGSYRLFGFRSTLSKNEDLHVSALPF